MDCQEVLWNIVEKIYFYDFSFTQEFITMIQSDIKYDGLYDILNLMMRKKFLLKNNTTHKIKTTNPYEMVQVIIDIHNTQLNAFMFEESNNSSVTVLSQMYSQLDKIFEESKNPCDPHTNILLLFSYSIENTLNLPHKYTEREVTKKCLFFTNIFNGWRSNNTDLVRKYVDIFVKNYPEVNSKFPEYILKKCQFLTEKKSPMEIANCTNILFPTSSTVQIMSMYNDLYKFSVLCEQLRFTEFFKGKQEDVKYLSQFRKYEDYTEMIGHETKMIEMASEISFSNDIKDDSNYMNYLKHLFETNSKFFSANLFVDYMSILYNNKCYLEVYNSFKKHENYFLYFIKNTRNIHMKLNLLLTIITCGNRINKTIPNRELTEIVNSLDMSKYPNESQLKKVYEKLCITIEYFKKIEDRLKEIGFEIINESIQGETCFICYTDIEDKNTRTIKGICCKKQLGHISCICKWLLTNQTCILCRSTTEQRECIARQQ